jgi:hypothetical protein
MKKKDCKDCSNWNSKKCNDDCFGYSGMPYFKRKKKVKKLGKSFKMPMTKY